MQHVNLQPLIAFDVLVYPLHAVQLFACTVDRFLVVFFPLKYFLYANRFVTVQLLASTTVFVIISTVTIISAIPFFDTQLSGYCR
jgi:hypothetical protein